MERSPQRTIQKATKQQESYLCPIQRQAKSSNRGLPAFGSYTKGYDCGGEKGGYDENHKNRLA